MHLQTLLVLLFAQLDGVVVKVYFEVVHTYVLGTWATRYSCLLKFAKILL